MFTSHSVTVEHVGRVGGSGSYFNSRNEAPENVVFGGEGREGTTTPEGLEKGEGGGFM